MPRIPPSYQPVHPKELDRETSTIARRLREDPRAKKLKCQQRARRARRVKENAGYTLNPMGQREVMVAPKLVSDLVVGSVDFGWGDLPEADRDEDADTQGSPEDPIPSQGRISKQSVASQQSWQSAAEDEGNDCAWAPGSPTGRQGSDLMAAKLKRASLRLGLGAPE